MSINSTLTGYLGGNSTINPLNRKIGSIGAVGDYNQLLNKPKIDGTVITSTSTSEDLGLITDDDIATYNEAGIVKPDGTSIIIAADGSMSVGIIGDNVDHRKITHREDAEQHPISAITNLESSLSNKQDTLVSGSNIKTINGASVLGSGDLPAGLVDDIKINNVSIVENKIANIIYETGLGQDSSNSATVTAIRSFVNSSIEAVAAYYITSDTTGNAFATKSLLDSGPWYYAGNLRTPTKNDYAMVIADETHENKSARYTYTDNQWAFQYTFNMGFTQAQIDAINSGITNAKVALYDSHLNNINNPHSVTKTQIGLSNVDNTSDADKPISTATQNALDTKQATINDLSTIRAGAALGATSYQKPDTGIPKTDLATAVQTSLGKADTALQEHQSLAAYRTSAAQDIIDATKVSDVKVNNSSVVTSGVANVTVPTNIDELEITETEFDDDPLIWKSESVIYENTTSVKTKLDNLSDASGVAYNDTTVQDRLDDLASADSVDYDELTFFAEFEMSAENVTYGTGSVSDELERIEDDKVNRDGIGQEIITYCDTSTSSKITLSLVSDMSAGYTGDVCISNGNAYICVSDGIWKQITLT